MRVSPASRARLRRRVLARLTCVAAAVSAAALVAALLAALGAGAPAAPGGCRGCALVHGEGATPAALLARARRSALGACAPDLSGRQTSGRPPPVAPGLRAVLPVSRLSVRCSVLVARG